jgi:sortase (surface protein transpeptidase)
MMKYIPRLTKLQKISVFGGLLMIVGIIGVAPTLYFRWTNTGTASASPILPASVVKEINAANKKQPQQSLVTGYPVSISIPGPRPALDMNVNIIPGYYNASTGAWTLTTTDAQFVTFSAQPNNITGNTYIYGHYRPNIFAYLHLISPGTIATITTSNGYQFNYKFVYTYAVTPSQTAVLQTSKAPILTIQTCSGDFFQNRQMYIFSYDGYSKV